MLQLSEQYIEASQIVQLLKKFKLLKALLGNLRTELELSIIKGREGIIGTDEQVLYAMTISSQILSDMPRSKSNPGDKATNTISAYHDIADKQFQQIKQDLIEEIIIISSVIDKVKCALSGIQERGCIILVEHYVNGKSWAVVGNMLNASSGYVKKILIHEALREMQTILRISVEDFEFCMGKVE